MSVIPIIIVTKNNYKNLYASLKSLEKTVDDNNPIIILDDRSDDENTKTFLYSSRELPISLDYIKKIDDKKIKSITKINGIFNKFNIIKSLSDLGKLYRVLAAIKHAFSCYPTAKECIILEDNVLYNKKWIKSMLNIYRANKDIKISMISFSSNYEFGALFTLNFYNELKNLGYYSYADFKGNELAYSLLKNIGSKLGFHSFSTLKNYGTRVDDENIEENFNYPISF